MKIDAMKFGIASALAFAIIWLFCSLFVWSMPAMTMEMTGNMMHSDWSQMGWHLSPMGVLVGMLGWSVGAGFTGGLLATIYNRLL